MTVLTREPEASVALPAAEARSEWRWALATIAAVAAVVIAVSVLAYTHMPLAMRKHPTPLAFAPDGWRWLQAFSWWDGAWYAGIADHGYTFSLRGGHQLPVVFFPAYPLAVRALSRLIGRNTVLAGFLVNLACGLAAAGLFFGWCRDRLSAGQARLALACLLLYPVAFYLFGTLYADSMFLLLAVGAFMLLERNRPTAAGLAAALAGATRPTGLVLIVALWVLALERRGGLGTPGQRRVDLSVLRRADGGLLLAPLGVALYSAFLGLRFGQPLLFLQAEQGWRQEPGWRTWLKVEWFGRLFKRPYLEPHHFHLVGHAVVAVVAGALVVVVFRRFGIGYGVYVAGIVGLCALATKDFIGLGRYVLAAFPLFAAEALVLSARRPALRWAALAVSVGLLLYLTSLHARNMLIS